MADMDIKWVGLNELRAAIAKNPQNVLDRTRVFLTRGLAVYKKTIISSPWVMGGAGGGAPVDTGHLRDTHVTTIDALRATIGPNTQVAKYAGAVHGTGVARKRSYQLRPWLDYTKQTNESKIESLYRDLLKDIVGGLAK